MITKDDIKRHYDTIHEHFNFKDFIGLSALIFGLLLSNTSLDKSKVQVVAPVEPQKEILQPKVVPKKAMKKKKKTSKKKAAKIPRKQRVTAYRE